MTDTHTIGTNSSTKASEIAHPPVDPIAELGEWHRRLSTIAQAPLEFCPDFPLLARRHEAWWTRSLDRPLILDIGPKQAGHEITRRLELLENPRQWLAAKQEDLEATCFAGDALPSIRVDFGPVMLGGLLGGRVEFQSDTTWTHAFIDDDWSNLPDWSIREDLPWWNLPRQLTALTVANARGRYLLKTPDLGGSADVLLNFRGATSLCMDVLERPEEMLSAINAIYPAWRKAFCELYRITTEAGAGLVHWLGLWSAKPYMIPACDFNFMIGCEQFDRLCLPDIARQAQTVGRAVFHLDGPEAAKHAESLCRVPAIEAIQFSPGAQNLSALAWLDVFKMIQKRGRAVVIACPAHEALDVCRELDPSGLALLIDGSAQKLDKTVNEISHYFIG